MLKLHSGLSDKTRTSRILNKNILIVNEFVRVVKSSIYDDKAFITFLDIARTYDGEGINNPMMIEEMKQFIRDYQTSKEFDV